MRNHPWSDGSFTLLMHGKKVFPARFLFYILQRVQIFFPGTHLDHFIHVVDKDFAVADMSGVERFLGGLNDALHREIAHDDLDLDLGKQGGVQLHAAVALAGPFLDAAAHDLRDGHAGDADVVHGFSQDVISG